MWTPLKFAGMPQSPERISAVSGPKFAILCGCVKEILLFNKIFPIVDTSLSCEDIRKGKEEYLYSTILVRTHTLKGLRHGSHSFTCKQHHACLSFVSIHQMALPLTEAADIKLQLTTHRPRRDERLSWPGWLTYSWWLTHISGHPSATGRAQDSESTPAKDRRYTAGPHSRTKLCDGTQLAIFGDILHPVFSASCVLHISDLHSKFTLRPHHVSKHGVHPICDCWD